MFKKNESIYDRIIRVVIAIILFYLGYAQATGIAQIVLYILALASLVTGLTGYCHLYSILHISTLKKSKEKPQEMESENKAGQREDYNRTQKKTDKYN